jgi:hypothetical protein
LEDNVLEVAAALVAGARVVPLAAALVAGAVLLPSEAEGRALAAALYAEVAGPPAVQSVLGAAVVLVGRPQLVSAVAALPAEAQLAAGLIAARARGFESGVAAARPPGPASASRPGQEAIRACLPDA